MPGFVPTGEVEIEWICDLGNGARRLVAWMENLDSEEYEPDKQIRDLQPWHPGLSNDSFNVIASMGTDCKQYPIFDIDQPSPDFEGWGARSLATYSVDARAMHWVKSTNNWHAYYRTPLRFNVYETLLYATAMQSAWMASYWQHGMTFLRAPWVRKPARTAAPAVTINTGSAPLNLDGYFDTFREPVQIDGARFNPHPLEPDRSYWLTNT